MAPIYCVPLDAFPVKILHEIGATLGRTFHAPVHFLPEVDTTEQSYDHSRGQHNSSSILVMLNSIIPTDHARIIGITTADLFIPIFTFVFGEAQIDGPAAVVSGQRLTNEYYGMEANNLIYYERLLKECTHELGHTYGLRHCLSDGCVMRKSTYVEDIDFKTSEFCPECRTYMEAK